MLATMPPKGIMRYLCKDDDFHYTEPLDKPGHIDKWPRRRKLLEGETLCMVVRGAVIGQDDEFRYTMDILNNGNIIKNKHPLHTEMPKQEFLDNVIAPMAYKMLHKLYVKRELERLDKENEDDKKEELSDAPNLDLASGAYASEQRES